MKILSTEKEILSVVEHYQKTLSLRQTAEHFNVHKNTIGRRLQAAKDLGLLPPLKKRHKAGKKKEGVSIEERPTESGRVLTSSSDTVRTLEGLLNHADVDLEKWQIVRHKINKWDAQTRGGGTVELWQVTAWLERRPEFFLKKVEMLEPVELTNRTHTPDPEITLIIPDSQHGFRRTEDGGLIPLHDRRALDVVLQAASMLTEKISRIVLLGDMLDLGPWSKYPSTIDMRWTTQPALISLHWFLKELRKACPSAECYFLAGNHEARIDKKLTESADEALHLRPAGKPESRPALSIPYLLSLDELGIEYVAPYGEILWLDGVKFTHGSLVRRRGGQTSTAYLQHATTSGVWGHVHRLELAQRTIQTPEGPKVITGMSPGCLCRTDGAVPHAAGDSLDWQQGFGLMYTTQTGVSLQLVPIIDGEAVVHGEHLVGSTRVEDIKRETGLNI